MKKMSALVLALVFALPAMAANEVDPVRVVNVGKAQGADSKKLLMKKDVLNEAAGDESQCIFFEDNTVFVVTGKDDQLKFKRTTKFKPKDIETMKTAIADAVKEEMASTPNKGGKSYDERPATVQYAGYTHHGDGSITGKYFLRKTPEATETVTMSKGLKWTLEKFDQICVPPRKK